MYKGAEEKEIYDGFLLEEFYSSDEVIEPSTMGDLELKCDRTDDGLRHEPFSVRILKGDSRPPHGKNRKY